MDTYMKFEVEITETGKTPFSSEEYNTFNRETKVFDTLEQAREFINERYKGHKKVKMYQDTKNGKSCHSGWIYCFKNKDISHNSREWLQQDWVQIRKHEITVIV